MTPEDRDKLKDYSVGVLQDIKSDEEDRQKAAELINLINELLGEDLPKLPDVEEIDLNLKKAEEERV